MISVVEGSSETIRTSTSYECCSPGCDSIRAPVLRARFAIREGMGHDLSLFYWDQLVHEVSTHAN